MFSNIKILFLMFLICIALLLFNYRDTTVKISLFDTTSTVIPFFENNDEPINSITQSPKKTHSKLIDNISNDDYIVECESDPWIVEDNYAEQEQYLQSLSNSTSPDRLLGYAFYATPPEGKSRLDLLLAYNETFPNNSLILMEAASLCSTSTYKCNNNFIDTAIASDKENGAMWLNGVNFFAEQEDDEGVLKSISGLVRTSMFNEKSGERITLYTQVLAGSNVNDFRTNLVSGIGIEAARASGVSHIFTWCQEGLDDNTKANACLDFGRNLTERANTLFSRYMGIAMQKLIYKAEDNIEMYQLMEKEEEKLTKFSRSKQTYKASSLMAHDEKSIRNWFHNLDSIGEIESLKVIIKDAILLSQQKGIVACING
jgi:hypothetical protein